MSGSGVSRMLSLLTVSVVLLAGLAVAAAPARAGDIPPPSETVWLCKPGIADNPCLDGSLGGTRYLANGGTAPFSYSPARKPRFDCFYVYPTQSEQSALNADYSRDPELKAVAVNQAAQFSRICDVYAPVYRQYTNQALGALNSLDPEGVAEIRDIAYDSMRSAFADFVSNHSKGRGFILIGHSQGASHLSRLIDEEIDPNPVMRKRMISAIVPGSNNIYVPKGGVVGGNLENIPACTRGNQLGCVMAWSLYLNRAEAGLPANSSFGRLETGYWVYPEDRPDSNSYEVLCVNPGQLSGLGGSFGSSGVGGNGGNGGAGGNGGIGGYGGFVGNGSVITPLANLPAFLGQTDAEDPWTEGQGLYRAECLSGEDSSWLDMSPVPGASASILDGVLPLINANLGGLHTGDINLVLGDLIAVASRQGARYAFWREAVAGARAASRRAVSTGKKAKRLAASQRRTSSACRNGRSASTCDRAKRLSRQARKTRATARRLSARASKLARRAERIYGTSSQPDLCPSVSPLGEEAEAGPRPGVRVC